MKKVLHYFERSIIMVLLGLMAVVIMVSLYELAVLIFKDIFDTRTSATHTLFSENNILEILSFIMLVVISLELFETIKLYLDRHVISADFIILVALTAVARKIIIMDYSRYEPLMIIGLGLIVIALALGYYFIKKADLMILKSKEEEEKE